MKTDEAKARAEQHWSDVRALRQAVVNEITPHMIAKETDAMLKAQRLAVLYDVASLEVLDVAPTVRYQLKRMILAAGGQVEEKE